MVVRWVLKLWGGVSTFSCLHFWCGLCVYPSCQRWSGSWPFSCWPCCLSPSPRGSVCFGSHAVYLHEGVFHARVFCAWWLASDCSGSRSSREGVLACIQGASDSLRYPSPGGETEYSVFGIAVRVLLRATSLPHGMVSSLRRAEVGPSLPCRVAALPLWLSCSDVLGPPVLLSYYVVRVISCGPGARSSLSPFLGCRSGSSELAWGFVEPLRTYELRCPASGCALHPRLCLGWASWVIPCYVFSCLACLVRGCGVLYFHH